MRVSSTPYLPQEKTWHRLDGPSIPTRPSPQQRASRWSASSRTAARDLRHPIRLAVRTHRAAVPATRLKPRLGGSVIGEPAEEFGEAHAGAGDLMGFAHVTIIARGCGIQRGLGASVNNPLVVDVEEPRSHSPGAPTNSHQEVTCHARSAQRNPRRGVGVS